MLFGVVYIPQYKCVQMQLKAFSRGQNSLHPLVLLTRWMWDKGKGSVSYLFTHADLHDGVADQGLLQVMVLLVLKPLDV